MNPQTELQSHISRLKRRVRSLLVERYTLYGACAGMLAASVMVLLSGRIDSLLNYWLWAGVVVIGAVAGFIFGFTRKLDDLGVAIAADKRTGLKERVSTAVSLSANPPRDDMETALITDANEHIAGRNPSEVFAHKFGLPHIAAGVALLILMLAIIVPVLPMLHSASRKQEIATMKSEGAKMVQAAKDLRKDVGKDDKQMRKLASRIEQLGKKMETGRMAKKQAMLKTQRLTKQIMKEQDKLAERNAGTKTMKQAQAEVSKSSMDIARKSAEEIAKKEQIPPQEAMKKVASDKRMGELARKTGPLTKSEQQELEKAVRKYANPDSNLPIPAELAEAMAKLSENADFQKTAELMQELAKKLNLGSMKASDKEALKKQMEALAKALKGTDLDKLAKQMRENAEKLAKMSPEELKKLAEQIKKSQQMAQSLKQAAGT